MAMRPFDVRPNRAAGTPCMRRPTAYNADQLALRTRCPKVLIAHKLAMHTFDVQSRAASTHCTKCCINAARLALCTFDVPPARAAGPQCTQCPTVFIVDQLAGAAAGEHCTV